MFNLSFFTVIVIFYNMDSKELDTNNTDIIVSALKGLLGAIPYAGSLAGEIFGNIIPKQRLDRFAAYIKELSSRIATLEENDLRWIEKLKHSSSNLLIYELSIKYSLETNSQILHNSFASVVFKAVEKNEKNTVINEKILRTISELTEEEIIWLIWFSEPSVLFYETEFQTRFKKILSPHSRSSGNSEEDRIHNALQDQYILNLHGKGLLYRKSVNVKNQTVSLSSGDKPPELKDFSITPYGDMIVDALYNEDFFGRIVI